MTELRRIRADRASVALPSDIGFLAEEGFPADRLASALAEAARGGVTAGEALIASGGVDADAYYRALARRAGLGFLDAPPPLAPDCDLDAALRGEGAALARSTFLARHVLAPRGENVARLLRCADLDPRTVEGVAIATPKLIAAAALRQFPARIAEESANGLVARDRGLSAREGASEARLALLALCLAGVGAMRMHDEFASLAAIALSLMFIIALVTRLAASLAHFNAPRVAPAPLADADLPVYSVIAALYGEARVAGDLLEALRRIDYPRAKLDVKLVLEERDVATRAALAALDPPPWIEIIVAPEGRPHTKPRALNLALRAARGEFVVVFDAEDRPDPDQLRKAAAAFRVAAPRVACLQARLLIDNSGDGCLTRWFAIEYATLFHVVIPGLAQLRAPIPLGGTSNHFRRSALNAIGGWDAWNVTEDADLGVRLARAGLLVEALDSTTREEAPSQPRAWIAQRSRWLKGWMQTLFVLMRSPRRLCRELGPGNAVTILAMLGANVLGALFGPLFVALFIHDFAFGELLSPRGPLQACASALAIVVFAFAPFALFLPAVFALRRMGRRGLGLWLALSPLYGLFMARAAWKALGEFLLRPHFWAKTEHGLARRREA